jgi:hypothetical protein
VGIGGSVLGIYFSRYLTPLSLTVPRSAPKAPARG